MSASPNPPSPPLDGLVPVPPPASLELATIARLALPISLAQFGLMLLGLVEVAILGHVSSTELGGASIGRSIGMVVIALGMGAVSALEPLAAQAIGAREPQVAFRAFLGSIVAALFLWAPCSALGYLATYALEAGGIARELVGPARSFFVAQIPGLFFFAVYLSAKTYLQANGKTLPALLAAIVANVVNVVACNVLIRGVLELGPVRVDVGVRPLGAFGAGLASTIASAVMAGWVLVPAFRLRPRASHPGASGRSTVAAEPTAAEGGRLSYVRRILTLGTPIGFQLLAEIGVFSFVAVLAGRLGTVAVSAHQIALSLASFTFMGVLGIAGATSVRVGHAIGEGRTPRQAGLLGIGLGALFMLACGAVFLFAPGPLVRLFSDDPDVVALGVRLLFIAAAFQLFDGLQGVAAGALRGAGDVRFPFLANFGAHWLVGFPLALLFGFHLGWGAAGLWWGLLVGLACVALLLTRRFVVLTRKTIGRV